MHADRWIDLSRLLFQFLPHIRNLLRLLRRSRHNLFHFWRRCFGRHLDHEIMRYESSIKANKRFEKNIVASLIHKKIYGTSKQGYRSTTHRIPEPSKLNSEILPGTRKLNRQRKTLMFGTRKYNRSNT
jgi:hypothetical protein